MEITYSSKTFKSGIQREIAEFNGVIFVKRKFYYFALTNTKYKIKTRLHHAVYLYYHPELDCIPPNCNIHHINGDKSNNDISNLILLTIAEHTQLHKVGSVGNNTGKPMSEETKQKLRIANKGTAPWNKGKSLSLEHKQAISSSMKSINR